MKAVLYAYRQHRSERRCNIDAVFQRVILRGRKKIGNTLATPDSFELTQSGSEY